MRVLVTGGYGFIGSFVAERFQKEGHRVYIIDNLSTGNAGNVKVPHKAYQLSVEDVKCEELFKSHKFDIVVHLAAQINVAHSLENPYQDSKSNILGLTNMLQLSAKYKVRKFIFASSAAVYGMNDRAPLAEQEHCEPVSPYGMNKWMGEYYCRKWSELYGLDTLCFRFSNVYGPRQGMVGEGGVVSIFMERLMKYQELIVYGDGEQTRDFIYVEDVADAICRSAGSDITGVYNLSTQAETSVNQLIRVLDQLHPLKGVQYRPPRPGDIVRSSLDNSRVKRALDWVPAHTFEEGIRKTFDWFSAQHQAKATAVKRKGESPWKSRCKFLLPYLENLSGFLIVLALTISFRENQYAAAFDYKLMYIILMGVMYGTRQSIISIILSSGLFFAAGLMNGREFISMLYDSQSLFQVAVYIFVGVAVGYSLDRKNREVAMKEADLASVNEKYGFLQQIYNDTRTVKEELQNQIINLEDSFGKIYSIIRELDSLEPEEIFRSAVKVMEKVMRTDEISIYAVDRSGDVLRLAAKSDKLSFEVPITIKTEEHPVVASAMKDHTVYANKTLDPALPLFMAPVLCNGRAVALVSVHSVGFERFTLSSQNKFQVAVGLISSALSRAYRYKAAIIQEEVLYA